MNLLLDTHVLLWWLADSPTLDEQARIEIRRGRNLVFVSAATAWEICIKKSLGKLDAPDGLEGAVQANRFHVLPISFREADRAGQLPRHHEDPFDRMLIAQAQENNLTLVTHDPRFRQYSVEVLWT